MPGIKMMHHRVSKSTENDGSMLVMAISPFRYGVNPMGKSPVGDKRCNIKQILVSQGEHVVLTDISPLTGLV
jgi:hypothetical protein